MKILSYNVWGAPIFSKDRAARMPLIADRLLELAPDVIALQEAYLEADRYALLRTLETAYPYYHYFASGVLGSGLFTLSKYPIVDAAFHRFRMGGKPDKVWHGDYLAGKGVGLVRLQTPSGTLDVYNMHPHAQYQHKTDNEYAAFTQSSLYEAARFIDAESRHNPAVICGDFNVQPDTAGYQIITTLAKLSDTLSGGVTFSRQSPYANGEPDQRLDYVMVRDGQAHGIQSKTAEIVMTERLTGKAKAYSDHYGVLAEIALTDTPQALPDTAENARDALEKLHATISDALTDARITRSTYNERAMLGFAGAADVTLIAGLLRRKYNATTWLRLLFWLASLFFGIGNVLQATLNIGARVQVLEVLQQEIQYQRSNQRLFNGDTWLVEDEHMI